jgi:Cu(I)/Ag(I) efflux system membrane fusion protein
MKTFVRPILVLCAVAICGGAYALWRTALAGRSPSQARKVLYYQDSMHPWIKSAQPGKCTICAMDLTPIREGESGFGLRDGTVVLSSNSVTVLNVQTEEVRRQPLSRALRVAGTLEPNEAHKTIVSAPSPGRIQTSAVESSGVEVEKGQKLITLFSPELVQRRAFLRTVGGDQSSVGKGLVQATEGANPYLGDIVAPQSGVVVERNVYPGQYVVEGEKLLTIVDASVLWFRFDAYEQQLPWLELGQTIEVTTAAIPGRRFPAVISFMEPTLNDATRTVKVRAEIKNPVVATNGHPRRLLRFGMYADGRVRAEIPNVLAVPRTAILFPGGAAYAYLRKGEGAYERRRVKLGRQGDDLWEVLHGLEEGDHVVTSGNVLIDAQAQFNQGGKPDDTGAEDVAPKEPKQEPENTGGAMSHAPAAAGPSEMAAPTGTLKPSQQKALTDFLAVADGISRALAADSLDQLKTHTGALPGVVASLVKETGDDPPWRALVNRIQATARWPAPADLAAARRTFLPFSTNVVELVQLVRGKEEAFSSLKVYHCPMAPKPGLWMQAQGPLRNPFYGSEMLECGREVKP